MRRNNPTNTDNSSPKGEVADSSVKPIPAQNVSIDASVETLDEMGGPCVDVWLSGIRVDEKYHLIVEMYEQLIKVYDQCKQENQQWASNYGLLTEINEDLKEKNQALAKINEDLKEKNQALTEINEDLKGKNQALTEINEDLKGKNQALTETNILLANSDAILCDGEQETEDAMSALESTHGTSNSQDDESFIASLEYEIEELRKENLHLSVKLQRSEWYNRVCQQMYLNLLQTNAYLTSHVGFLESMNREQAETSVVLEQRVRELSAENELLNDCYQEDVENYSVTSQANEGLLAIILQQQQELETLKASLKRYEDNESEMSRATMPGLFSV